MAHTILLVDDEPNLRSSFEKILSMEGYRVETAETAAEALEIFRKGGIDLVVMDICMPGLSGLEAVAKFKAIDSKTLIILMTAHGSVETAIEAMKQGAYEYVLKPFDIPVMAGLIRKALEVGRLMNVGVEYTAEPTSADRIIGVSAKMQNIYKLVGQVAASDITVLVRGESGTGKELVARAIYHHSKRKDRPFLAINSAAIPDALLESELFGYEKGAFTDARERRIGKLEQYSGGTIFLDEVGDMSYSTQTKILRVLQEQSFERLGGQQTVKTDVRFIAATNKNLESLVKEGKFREDLFYRLNAFTIDLPPLREHKDDILPMVEYFVAKYSREFEKKIGALPAETLSVLMNYDWPGNIRELENVIKKAVLLTRSTVILPEHIILRPPGASPKPVASFEPLIRERMQSTEGNLYAEVIEDVERALLVDVLRHTEGNQSQAAKILGISRPTLRERVEKLNIKPLIRIKES